MQQQQKNSENKYPKNGKNQRRDDPAPTINVQTTHTPKGPDPECDKKCANKGVCNEDKICQCPEGYMGQYCQTALCYPQCMNGGNCTAPGTCSCPPGYQGRHCEGGNVPKLAHTLSLSLSLWTHPSQTYPFPKPSFFGRHLCRKVSERGQMHSEGQVRMHQGLLRAALRVL